MFENIHQLPEQQTIKNSLITLEEKIEEIVKRLNTKCEDAVGFGSLSKNKSCSEIIVLFLALLHLLTKQLIKVEQKDKFNEIIISKI